MVLIKYLNYDLYIHPTIVAVPGDAVATLYVHKTFTGQKQQFADVLQNTSSFLQYSQKNTCVGISF